MPPLSRAMNRVYGGQGFLCCVLFIRICTAVNPLDVNVFQSKNEIATCFYDVFQ